MNKTNVAKVAVVAGLAMGSSADVATNWVADASFEALSSWNQPNPTNTSGWVSIETLNAANWGWVARSTTLAKSGSQALKFTHWAGNATAFQDLALALDSNTVYEVSFAMRLDNLSTNPAHTNETEIGVVLDSSPSFGGSYSWTGKSFYDIAPSATGAWQTVTITFDGADPTLADNHGEYIRFQLKKFAAAKNSEYEIFVDDVSFGEYTTAPAPAGLLLGCYGTKGTNVDYHAAGIAGNLFASKADGSGIDESAGSDDGTYGTLPGASILPTGYKVHIGNTNNNRRVDVQIENNTGASLQLDSISFDYGRWWPAGPRDVALAYAYGDLGGITNNTVLFTATNLAVTGVFGDYHDFDVSLAGLADRTLGLGETATFRLSIDNADGIWDKGAFDNIAIFGTTATTAWFVSAAPASTNQLKLVVYASGDPTAYSLVGTDDLAGGAWSAAAFSDNGSSPYQTTNLAYSTTDGTNRFIYVDAAAPKKFYGLSY